MIVRLRTLNYQINVQVHFCNFRVSDTDTCVDTANAFLKFLESDGGKATLKQNLIGNLAIEVTETEIDAVLDTVLPAWIEAGRKGGNAEACANIF